MAVHTSKSKRRWLNEREGTAFIAWKIETVTFKDKKNARHNNVDACFNLADCSRRVSIDFSVYGKHGHKSRMKKLDRLVEELLVFKKEYMKAIRKT